MNPENTASQHDDIVVVLDVMTIPRAIRHAAVRGAFGSIPVGGSMEIVAPQRPVILLAELADDADGALAVEFLSERPGEWHVRLTRTVAAGRA